MKQSIVFFILFSSIVLHGQSYPKPEMVLVKGGEYLMGLPAKGELVRHVVRVNSFYMSTNKAIIGDFKQFCDETGLKFNFKNFFMLDYVSGLHGEAGKLEDHYPMYFLT